MPACPARHVVVLPHSRVSCSARRGDAYPATAGTLTATPPWRSCFPLYGATPVDRSTRTPLGRARPVVTAPGGSSRDVDSRSRGAPPARPPPCSRRHAGTRPDLPPSWRRRAGGPSHPQAQRGPGPPHRPVRRLRPPQGGLQADPGQQAAGGGSARAAAARGDESALPARDRGPGADWCATSSTPAETPAVLPRRRGPGAAGLLHPDRRCRATRSSSRSRSLVILADSFAWGGRSEGRHQRFPDHPESMRRSSGTASAGPR